MTASHHHPPSICLMAFTTGPFNFDVCMLNHPVFFGKIFLELLFRSENQQIEAIKARTSYRTVITAEAPQGPPTNEFQFQLVLHKQSQLLTNTFTRKRLDSSICISHFIIHYTKAKVQGPQNLKGNLSFCYSLNVLLDTIYRPSSLHGPTNLFTQTNKL